jgi:hypothetical protein
MKHLIRLHQLLLILAILSGCYAPDLRDCTVTCSGATDCASGQVCGSDGYCAAEGVAGSCGNAVDAAVDGTPSVMVRVMVMGNGHVELVGAGTCGQSGPGDCVMQVPKNSHVVANAVTHDSNKPFDKWVSTTCAGQDATCMFTAFLTTTTITAKFR